VLSIVPTPIGNLGDITLRALETLRACDLVAAEDTRHSGMLLHHFEISKPFISFHEHNEASRTAELVPRIAQGLHVALVTDAGMPGISDPGTRLIRACRAEGLPVTVLPGPCAATTALVGSGLAAETFTFGGFLPNKSGRRIKTLEKALESPSPTVFHESPHRILKSLEAIKSLAPDRTLSVARELTKRHEEYRLGTAQELINHFTARPPKGEICLVISPAHARSPAACRT
jgi:16S rRNA (cytidine1402-2'-O)-methyltransferase